MPNKIDGIISSLLFNLEGLVSPDMSTLSTEDMELITAIVTSTRDELAGFISNLTFFNITVERKRMEEVIDELILEIGIDDLTTDAIYTFFLLIQDARDRDINQIQVLLVLEIMTRLLAGSEGPEEEESWDGRILIEQDKELDSINEIKHLLEVLNVTGSDDIMFETDSAFDEL